MPRTNQIRRVGKKQAMGPKKRNQPSKDKDNASPRRASPPMAVPRRNILPNIPDSRTGKKRTKEPPRYKPPPRFLLEIQRLQSATNRLIPGAVFAKVVKDITQNNFGHLVDLKFQSNALKCLHESAEAYIVGVFEDSYLCTLHRNRVTLTEKDIRLAQRIRGDIQRFG